MTLTHKLGTSSGRVEQAAPSMNATRDHIITLLAAEFARSSRVTFAVLFGSWARGHARADSDVDVAILPAGGISRAEELALAARLSTASARVVDLVRLDEASTLLRWRVAREGLLLHAASPESWPRFRVTAASEYCDFSEAIAGPAELFRRRIAAAGGRD
jgi:predicted nucleotidyltransferase